MIMKERLLTGYQSNERCGAFWSIPKKNKNQLAAVVFSCNSGGNIVDVVVVVIIRVLMLLFLVVLKVELVSEWMMLTGWCY